MRMSFPGVYSGFCERYYGGFGVRITHLRKYERLICIPKGELYPWEIIDGFKEVLLLLSTISII